MKLARHNSTPCRVDRTTGQRKKCSNCGTSYGVYWWHDLEAGRGYRGERRCNLEQCASAALVREAGYTSYSPPRTWLIYCLSCAMRVNTGQTTGTVPQPAQPQPQSATVYRAGDTNGLRGYPYRGFGSDVRSDPYCVNCAKRYSEHDFEADGCVGLRSTFQIDGTRSNTSDGSDITAPLTAFPNASERVSFLDSVELPMSLSQIDPRRMAGIETALPVEQRTTTQVCGADFGIRVDVIGTRFEICVTQSELVTRILAVEREARGSILFRSARDLTSKGFRMGPMLEDA